MYVLSFACSEDLLSFPSHHKFRDRFFVPEAIGIYKFAVLHMLGRNASSPAAQDSCNKGRVPDLILNDQLSFGGSMLAHDFPQISHVINVPTTVIQIGVDPIWFPSPVSESPVLSMSVFELLKNAYSTVRYVEHSLTITPSPQHLICFVVAGMSPRYSCRRWAKSTNFVPRNTARHQCRLRRCLETTRRWLL
jgi:hypothetical protein